jgi:hypothetical protein
MDELRLNGKPAVRINARHIRDYKRAGGKLSKLFDCEGDEVWFPDQCVKIEAGGSTLLVEQWLYNKKVEDGQL